MCPSFVVQGAFEQGKAGISSSRMNSQELVIFDWASVTKNGDNIWIV
jgi:hypothetical protein